MGKTVLIVLNSNVVSRFNANAAQKNDKNNAASLNINHIKQYCIVRYKLVTSFIPYILSVNISVNKKIKVPKRSIKNKFILIISKKKVHNDNPNKMKSISII